jgi:hypothetical protein
MFSVEDWGNNSVPGVFTVIIPCRDDVSSLKMTYFSLKRCVKFGSQSALEDLFTERTVSISN